VKLRDYSRAMQAPCGTVVEQLSVSSDTCSWDDLEVELEHWRCAGRAVTLWWRDDDAINSTPALQRLAQLSSRCQVPLSLAVIPARADSTLIVILNECVGAQVLQHGYAHTDYGNGAEPAAELGGHRPAQLVLGELRRGRERLMNLLGEYFLPVLVPPWNRIEPCLVPRLVAAGYYGLSCFSARESSADSPGLLVANCHVDPVHWKQAGAFRGESKSLSMLVGHLRARREGEVDVSEPTGVLTHHWSHDEQTWAFLGRLFEQTRGHNNVHWLDARQVFAS
jgi:hypothetical protein